MNKKINVKPGKTQSLMGFIVGLIFCGIGLFIVIPLFGMFGIFWAMVAVMITVTNGINAFSSKGIATHRIEIEDENIHAMANRTESENVNDIENVNMKKRLNQLNDLYKADLLTKEEYEKKRKEFIAKL